MRHLDLFSGIGGFSLAASWIWGSQHELVSFCERDEFCQRVLKKHWPDVPCISDIHDVTREIIWENYVLNANRLKLQKIDHTASHATQNECLHGEYKTGRNIDKHQGNGVVVKNKRLSRIMAESAPVAEKQPLNSSPLTIRKTMEMQSEENINPKHGNWHLKEDCQKTTKSCVTTAITQERTTEYAHIKGGMIIDLLTAGVPCQPASVAGKRRGQKDDRWLWPQAIRIVREVYPRWVLFENVHGMCSLDNGLALDQVLADLESEGYEVQTFLVPACAVNAPHRRNRIWLIANTQSAKRELSRNTWERRAGFANGSCDDERSFSDAESEQTGRLFKRGVPANISASRDWTGQTAAWSTESTFCGVADGVPRRMERLRALGNAIVPQVAAVFFDAMKHVDLLYNLN